MSAEVTNALTDFGTQVTTAINPVDALQVIGITLTAAAGLYFAMWGARKLVSSVRDALNKKFHA